MNSKLTALRIDLGDVTADVAASFGRLLPDELNWKPAPDSWSVGQCFEHLNAAGTGMIDAIQAKIDGSSRTTGAPPPGMGWRFHWGKGALERAGRCWG